MISAWFWPPTTLYFVAPLFWLLPSINFEFFCFEDQNLRANSCLLDKISVPFKFFIIFFLIFSKFTAQQTQQVFIKFWFHFCVVVFHAKSKFHMANPTIELYYEFWAGECWTYGKCTHDEVFFFFLLYLLVEIWSSSNS